MREDLSFILTGAPGSGKSTLLAHLAARGLAVVPEPARQILAEQRSIGGAGLPGHDDALFVDLMLSRAMGSYTAMAGSTVPVLFDRGIPDMVCYAALFGLASAPAQCAADLYRYNPRIFVLPAWEAIYATDEERRMSFDAARRFGDDLRALYVRLGYTPIDLPEAPVEERAAIILAVVGGLQTADR